MKNKLIMLCITVLSISCLIACTKETVEEEKEPSVSAEQTDVPEETGSPEVEEPKEERLKLTDFTNLPKAAEQVGFSFRALESFECDEYKFGSFTMEQDVEEVNGMKVAAPNSTMKLHYKKPMAMAGLFWEIDVIMFPYEGEEVLPTLWNPICYVSTTQINGIDVHLAEYIHVIVKPDYEMTEEDYELQESGKGSFGVDSIGDGPKIVSCMYWVEEGIYYGIDFMERDLPFETLEGFVAEFMAGELQ